MKWADVAEGTKVKLLKDLLFIDTDALNGYMYYTRDEIEKNITVVHTAGTIYTFDPENGCLGAPGQAHIGIDSDDGQEVEPDLYEILPPTP